MVDDTTLNTEGTTEEEVTVEGEPDVLELNRLQMKCKGQSCDLEEMPPRDPLASVSNTYMSDLDSAERLMKIGLRGAIGCPIMMMFIATNIVTLWVILEKCDRYTLTENMILALIGATVAELASTVMIMAKYSYSSD